MFPGNRSTGIEENEVERLVDGSIAWLVRLNAWFQTVVKCLTKKETCGGHPYNLGMDMYWNVLLLALEQLTGSVCAFAESPSAGHVNRSYQGQSVTFWKWCALFWVDNFIQSNAECMRSGDCEEITRCGTKLLCKKNKSGAWGSTTSGHYYTANRVGMLKSSGV